MNSLFKYIIIRLAILVTLLCTFFLIMLDESRASDAYMSGFVGVFNSAKSSLAEVKSLNIGIRDDAFFGFSYQYELGFWTDSTNQGRSGSGYGAFQVGLEAGDSTVARVMFGPVLITTPDSYLGGMFPEFTEDFFLGIRGKNWNTVGIKYKHISNAGFYSNNTGRDFLGTEISIPF